MHKGHNQPIKILKKKKTKKPKKIEIEKVRTRV
jgi:hypothetical protein